MLPYGGGRFPASDRPQREKAPIRQGRMGLGLDVDSEASSLDRPFLERLFLSCSDLGCKRNQTHVAVQ